MPERDVRSDQVMSERPNYIPQVSEFGFCLPDIYHEAVLTVQGPEASNILVNFLKTNKSLPPPDALQVDNQHREERSGSQWEPFLGEPVSEQKFINMYGGNYARSMELNRKNAERLIRVAALDGVVVLASMPYSRTRSAEVNPDGTTTAKKGLFWGEKVEDEDNPYFRTVPIPEGWRIEICDQRIRNELAEKYAGEKLEKKFVAAFNKHLRSGLWDATWKEKLTMVKDKTLLVRVGFDVGTHSFLGVLLVPDPLNIWSAVYISTAIATRGIVYLIIGDSGERIRKTLDSYADYFMPSVEVDKVLRGFLYLGLKGRNLVRLTPQKSGE